MTDTPPMTQDTTTGVVVIPADVYVQIMTIRSLGESNMMDRRGVQESADRHGFYAAVVWLEENQHAYGVGCRMGFVPDRLLTEDEQDALAEALS